eukprot:s912_g35.t1
MPDIERDIRKPLDVTKEAVVAHYARFFSLAQFAVLTTEILKARGEPQPLLYGWAGSVLPIDQPTAQDCFFDLVDFAKRQWNERYHNVNGLNYSHEEEATASDVKDFPLARSRKYCDMKEGVHRDFGPVARREGKGKGKGKGRGGRPAFERMVECWSCGQYGHRSFECPSYQSQYGGWQYDRRGYWSQDYQRRSGGQADWNYGGSWSQTYARQRPNEEWGGATSSTAPRSPPGPPPASSSTSAAASTPATDDPVTPLLPSIPIVHEEYTEIGGMPHTCQQLADGSIHYIPW